MQTGMYPLDTPTHAHLLWQDSCHDPMTSASINPHLALSTDRWFSHFWLWQCNQDKRWAVENFSPLPSLNFSMAIWALLIFALGWKEQPGNAGQQPAHWEEAEDGFSSSFHAFNTNNLVMPPSSLVPATRPMFVVSAEVCLTEQFHFVILKL